MTSPDHIGADNMAMDRRASEGNQLGPQEHNGSQGPKQAFASPTMSNARSPPHDDFTSRMENMTLMAHPSLAPAFDYIPEEYPTRPPFSPYIPHPSNFHRPSYPSQPYIPPASYGYSPNPYPPDFSVETMHGMPGYPGRPPISRSNRTSPMNPSSPYGHSPQQPFGRPPPGAWGSPPMSPAPPFGSMGQMSSGRHSRHPSYADDYSQGRFAPSGWTVPSSSSSFTYYTPYQQQMPMMDAPNSEWPSPAIPQQPFSQRPSWQPPRASPNRVSWSGPSRQAPDDKERERKSYHPQPPARRSDHVMWVGNVPQNTSHEELWRYFNNTKPVVGNAILDDQPWRGPSSIFLISRSSCAFVNLSTQEDLDRAVTFFNGRALRPWDQRCPRMVCRVRKKDDDLRAGVGAQRGTGMHKEWIKAQGATEASPSNDGSIPPSPAVLEPIPDGEGRRRESVVDHALAYAPKSSASFASTNSSFLVKHFPKRVFILKSLTTAELETSVKNGTWRTQRHNEPILDQAFRTSSEVFLVFGANRSGGFFGYAKMVEPIDKEKALARAASGKSSSSGSHGKKSHPQPIQEEVEESVRSETLPIRPTYFLSPSASQFASSSPGQLTPSEEAQLEAKWKTDRHTAPLPVPKGDKAAGYRAHTLDTKGYFPPVPNASSDGEAERQEQMGGSSREQEETGDGILAKDTALTEGEKKERSAEQPDADFAPDGWGKVFKIEWVKHGGLPFHRIRHLRNPWNADREVKVSRDGTEVEPGVGTQLMGEWDKVGTELPDGLRYPSVY